MAINSQIVCTKCGKKKYVMHSASKPAPHVCSECEGQERILKEEEYFKDLKRRTIEERLEKIERDLYHIQGGVRILANKSDRFNVYG